MFEEQATNTSLIRYLIGASRVKFDILDGLYAAINTSQYRMGVLLVDADSIFYRLFRQKEFESMFADTKDDLVRDLVVGFYNVLGHYRRYMATRMRLDNDIYVFFNRSLPKFHEKVYQNWRSKEYTKYDPKGQNQFIAECINEAYSFIVSLSPYFEGIYVLDNDGIDDYALIARLGFQDDILYTIFSRNLYATQFLSDNVVQLFNKRDDSYLITKETCYKNGILKDHKTKADDKLTPDMLPLLWAIGGCKSVDVDPVKYCSGITSMVKIANKMAAAGDLVPNMSIQSFLDVVPKYSAHAMQLRVDRSKLEQRYKVTCARIAGAGITSDQLAKVRAMCYDIYNENELEQLNELLAAGEVDPDIIEITNLNMCDAVRYE